MRHRLRRFVHILFFLDDSPHRIALSFAIGVWIAFCPLIGIHTALALAIAITFRLSRSAILLGAYVNNPWTLAPLYMSGTLLGCALLGVSPAELWQVKWTHGPRLIETLAGLRPLLWPFVVGNVLLGSLSSVLAYGVTRRVLERRKAAPQPPPATAPTASDAD
jgi:uncharacterized protein (DUF2062 family)